MDNYISELIIPYRDILKQFTRKKYERSFMEYEEKCKETVRLLQHGYDDASDRQAFIKEKVMEYVSAVKKESADNPSLGRMKRKKLYEDYRLTTLFYVIPMLSRASGYASKKFIEGLVECWPEAKIKVSSFERLNEGFRTSFFENFFGKKKD